MEFEINKYLTQNRKVEKKKEKERQRRKKKKEREM